MAIRLGVAGLQSSWRTACTAARLVFGCAISLAACALLFAQQRALPEVKERTAVLRIIDGTVEAATPAAAIGSDRDMLRAVALEHIGIVADPKLPGLVSAECSPDGKQLYVAAFATDGVHVFDRDAQTGKLKHRQTVTDRANLAGALSLRLSSSSRYGVTTSIFSKTVSLFQRQDNGELKLCDVTSDPPGPVLNWPTDAAFSPDEQFIYVLDARGDAVVVFQVNDDGALKWVETDVGRDQCLGNARGIAMHPDGKTLFVASARSGCLVVVDRDLTTGHVTVREVINDGGGIRVLAGVNGVCCSSDGNFVYTCGGRVQGAHAIAAFRIQPNRTLSIMQAFINDEAILRDFQGGNEIIISPDGLHVYASGTLSGSVACFGRDPEKGKLTYLGTLRDDTTGLGSNLGACGLACSPDGKFLYVTLENQGAVSIFRRLSSP